METENFTKIMNNVAHIEDMLQITYTIILKEAKESDDIDYLKKLIRINEEKLNFAVYKFVTNMIEDKIKFLMKK